MRILAAILVLAAALAGAARAESLPDQRPMLRIEPGMHTATINRVGVDAACTRMATGSDDKTARLWALPEGGRGEAELLRTLRAPIGEGNDGKVYAVALSPDGKWVAAGGWDARYSIGRTMSVYIFEAATGRLVTRVGRFGHVIEHLAFSPDGGRLAATLGSGEGMRLWETAGWRLLAEDKDYGGKRSYGAAFDGANRLYTVAFDGQIRRYGADGRLEAKAKTQGGKEPFSVAVHPQGGKLAIGFADTTAVEVYDSRTLKRLYAADTSGIGGFGTGSVAWAADGTRLYAGGGDYKVDGRNPVVIWPGEGRGKRSEAPLSQSTIAQLLPCGDGVAAGAADPAFGLIAADGAKRVWREGVTADMRDAFDAFLLSADGKGVLFGLQQYGKKPVRFDLAAFRLTEAPQAVAGLAASKVSGLAVSDWNDTTAPTLNGKPIALEAYETSRSLAIAPDASRFVLGADWTLRAYRADGGELWQKPVPGAAWGVNVSGDGRLVAAAYADGTIRWHRLSDGQELLALFVNAKDKRYVAWTPKGYYAASPGAEDLIGWHVNRDWDHAPDFFPASRFRDQFNRPDIVKRVLDDLDEDAAIAEANRLANAKPAEEITKRLPPVITILAPKEGAAFASDSLTVSYSVRSPAGLPISEVTALVDGHPLPGAKAKGFIPVSLSDEAEQSLILTGVPAKDINLSLVARAGDVESERVTISLKYKGSTPEPVAARVAGGGALKRSLYLLAVGAGDFQDAQIPHLDYAGKDARDFAAALKNQEGKLYSAVEVKLLTGDKADRASIVRGLTWLKRQVARGDVGMVFLSGHGVSDPIGDYYFVPHNAEIENVGGLSLPTRDSSVPDSEFSAAFKNVAGDAFFLFDTCHAGKAAGIAMKGEQDFNKFINVMRDASAVVLASSSGAELSQERSEWQHGAFTQAVLEGLSGAADSDKDGVVTVNELILYVEKRVVKLTGGLQHPVETKPKETSDFAVAMP